MINEDGNQTFLDEATKKIIDDKIKNHIKAYHKENTEKYLKTCDSGITYEIRDEEKNVICECGSRHFIVYKNNIKCIRCRKRYPLNQERKLDE